MKNYEKYLDLVLEAAAKFIAVDKNGNPCECSEISCNRCCFCADKHKECAEKALEWLKEEYVEPEVDWSKVEVDTKILVRDSEEAPWKPRHFACFKDGNVFSYAGGASSFTADNDITPWKYAKLYEGEQDGK